jgi:hypothetical protein
MYLYIGKVQVGPLSGYLWLLGNRLYLKLSWRPRDTYFLGNLSDPLTLAARLKRLIPRPVDVRKSCCCSWPRRWPLRCIWLDAVETAPNGRYARGRPK